VGCQSRDDWKGLKIMTLGLAYWVLMLIWLVWGLLTHFGYAGSYSADVNVVLLFILFLLLGWQTFGPPLHR
jgi:hypothetical protein